MPHNNRRSINPPTFLLSLSISWNIQTIADLSIVKFIIIETKHQLVESCVHFVASRKFEYFLSYKIFLWSKNIADISQIMTDINANSIQKMCPNQVTYSIYLNMLLSCCLV